MVSLHCLPAYRGEEVTSEVIDGPRSLVLDPGRRSAADRPGVLCLLLAGKLRGHSDALPVPADGTPLVGAMTAATTQGDGR